MPKREFDEGDERDANLDPVRLPSAARGFRPLGSFTQAVVLRLASELPRIKVVRASDWEEEEPTTR